MADAAGGEALANGEHLGRAAGLAHHRAKLPARLAMAGIRAQHGPVFGFRLALAAQSLERRAALIAGRVRVPRDEEVQRLLRPQQDVVAARQPDARVRYVRIEAQGGFERARGGGEVVAVELEMAEPHMDRRVIRLRR